MKPCGCCIALLAANHGIWQWLWPHQQPVSTTRRRRTTTPSSPSSPPALEPQAPVEPPWLEHPTLSGLRDRLQLVYDCWTLLELPDGNSRRPVYLPRGIEEPETCYLKRLEAG